MRQAYSFLLLQVVGDGSNIANSRKVDASFSSDDEDEEVMTEGEDNGLRVCGKDMIVETGQKHGKRHGAFAFVYDFLHSIMIIELKLNFLLMVR
nr:hypothetical protein [Tanacetum cinerariifolium]